MFKKYLFNIKKCLYNVKKWLINMKKCLFNVEACIYNSDPENPDLDQTRIQVRAGKFLLKLTRAGSGPANDFCANPDLS